MKKALIILLMAATAATPALAKGPKHGGGKGHEARAERHEQRQEHKQHKQEMRAERQFERHEARAERHHDFSFDRHAAREARRAERREHRFEQRAPEFRAERHWAKAERKQARHFERRAERQFERADKHAFKAERKFAKKEAKFERKFHKQEAKFERKLAKAEDRSFAIERRLRMRQAEAPREYYEVRERRYFYAPAPLFAAAPSYAYVPPAPAYQLYAPAYGGDYYGPQSAYPGVSYGDDGLGSLLGGGGMSGILTALLPVFLQQAGLGDLGGLGGFGDVAGLGGYGADPAAHDPAYEDYAGEEPVQGGLGELAGLGGLGDMGSLLPVVGTLLGGGLGTGDSLLGGLGGLGDIGSLAGLGGGLGLGGADGMMTGYDDYAGYEADPQATLMQAVLPALMG